MSIVNGILYVQNISGLPLVLTYCLFVFCQKIQSEIVDVFMTFTRPVIQSADHEEGKS